MLVVAWQFRPLLLQESPACRGLLEWLTAATLPAFASAPIGTVLTALNSTIAFTALAVFARLLYLLSRSVAVAVAIAGAVVATGVFERTLAAAVAPAMLGLCAAGWLQLHHASDGPAQERRRHLLTAVCLFAFMMLLSPAWLPGCRAVSSGPFDGFVASLGPLPFALAALGVFAALPRLQHADARVPAALAAIPLVPAILLRSAPEGTAILAAALWCLASVGLAHVFEHASPRRVSRLLWLALVLLVPVLQIERLRHSDDSPRVVRDGHETMTLDGMRRLARAMPAVTVIAEDASVELLLRAARVERMGKPLTIVPREPAAIAAASARGAVYAFTLAQRELQYRGIGFRAPDIGGPLAAVDTVRECVALGGTWADVTRQLHTGRFALVAPRADVRGPVELYLGSDVSVGATARGWASRDLRGFHVRESRARTTAGPRRRVARGRRAFRQRPPHNGEGDPAGDVAHARCTPSPAGRPAAAGRGARPVRRPRSGARPLPVARVRAAEIWRWR